MEKVKMSVTKAEAVVTYKELITTGMVGAIVSFTFDSAWDGLIKTAVFEGGRVTKDVVGIIDSAEIPHEVLAKPTTLRIGVYGYLPDGTIVIPTVMATVCHIAPGADPSNDPTSARPLTVWEQILAWIGDMGLLTTEAKENLVAAINELVAGIADLERRKVNISDIVNDLVTNVADRPLSAAQGVVLKGLADALQTAVAKAQKTADDAKVEARENLTAHNVNTEAHADLRLELQELADWVKDLLDSDDETLNEMHEIVAYITSNKALIDAITTSKVNVSDIVNDLVTNVANKPLSAAQGVVLKGLTDALQAAVSKAQETADGAKTEAQTNLTAHNVATDAHADLRAELQKLVAKVTALLDCDDATLDQTSEIVAYIKSNKTLIDAITTSKVNVSDIVDNLVTNVADKPLSAAQGVALKALIDALQAAVNGKAPTSHASADTTYGAGTGSDYGHVKLSDATNSTSSASGGVAATPAAVKAAYDLANTANSTAGTAKNTADAALAAVNELKTSAISVLSGTAEPTSADGTDGDIYLVLEE